MSYPEPAAIVAPRSGVEVPPSKPPADASNGVPDSAAESVAPRPSLGAGALAEWLGTPKTLVVGARLAVRYPLGQTVVPALSLDGALGQASAGRASVNVAAFGATAVVFLGVTTERFRWDVGPALRLSWVRLSGEPEPSSALEGRDLSGMWGGPELRARVAYGRENPGEPAFTLELGSGVVVLPVRGRLDGAASVFAVDGYWLSASAQVGFAF